MKVEGKQQLSEIEQKHGKPWLILKQEEAGTERLRKVEDKDGKQRKVSGRRLNRWWV